MDANTLLRSAFEYIMTGMMIQFDGKVYEEFITLGIEKDKTKINKIISKFRTHMNEICSEIYQNINRKEKLEILTELYEKLCNFTHSSLIVSTIIEIKNLKEKEIIQKLMLQNYYSLKLLLFNCLKYFTSDKKHYLELSNIGLSFMFMMIEISNKIKENNIDFSKYNDFLYSDKNTGYLEKDKQKFKKIEEELIELKEDIKNNEDTFTKELIMFIKK